MEKTRFYEYTKFPPEILREGRLALTSDVSKKPNSTMFEVYVGRDVWEFDAEDEVFVGYRKHEAYKATYMVRFDRGSTTFMTNMDFEWRLMKQGHARVSQWPISCSG